MHGRTQSIRGSYPHALHSYSGAWEAQNQTLSASGGVTFRGKAITLEVGTGTLHRLRKTGEKHDTHECTVPSSIFVVIFYLFLSSSTSKTVAQGKAAN
eukprot:c22643_g1_i1 orf=711-1004(+)